MRDASLIAPDGADVDSGHVDDSCLGEAGVSPGLRELMAVDGYSAVLEGQSGPWGAQRGCEVVEERVLSDVVALGQFGYGPGGWFVPGGFPVAHGLGGGADCLCRLGLGEFGFEPGDAQAVAQPAQDGEPGTGREGPVFALWWGGLCGHAKRMPSSGTESKYFVPGRCLFAFGG